MNKQDTLFERFDRRPKLYVALVIIVYLLINNGINATSDWMEATRNGATPEFALWEPITWELSSALSVLLILPLMFFWFSRFPLKLENASRQIFLHIIATLVFSGIHVGLMVMMREGIYNFMQGNYNFGNVPSEFFYEYRKDAWGYVFWLLSFTVYHFVYSRLKGEATFIDEEDNSAGVTVQDAPEHFLVKKLDKEFIVKVEDIEWLEAAGNYVNLHAKGRIYPLRATLSSLIPRLESKGFSRVHRSYGINHSSVDSMQALPSGDAEICLHNKQLIPLSRRYKDAFKTKLQ